MNTENLMRILILGLILGLAACGSDSAPAEDATPNWWETEGGEDPNNQDDGKDEYADDDKGDKGDGTLDEGTSWECGIDTATAQGKCTYRLNTLETGATCELQLAIASTTALEDCTECSFAWDITLGEATIVTETEEGCAEFEALAGTNILFGQGSEIIANYAGVDYFNLYSHTDEAWAITEAGYSSIKTETMWSFGVK